MHFAPFEMQSQNANLAAQKACSRNDFMLFVSQEIAYCAKQKVDKLRYNQIEALFQIINFWDPGYHGRYELRRIIITIDLILDHMLSLFDLERAMELF